MQVLPHVRQQSSSHRFFPSTLKCLHGDLHGLHSARQLSRPVSQLPASQSLHRGRNGRRSSSTQTCAGMAEMCVSHLNGWLVYSGSHQSPKMGAPSLTHSSRSAQDWLMTSQSHATAPTRPAATQVGPLLSLGQLRQSHPVSAISGPGSHSQLQVRRSPRRHWLADQVGERASASAMACRSIANRKG